MLMCKRSLCKTASDRNICVSEMMFGKLYTKICMWARVSIGKGNSPKGGHSQYFIP